MRDRRSQGRNGGVSFLRFLEVQCYVGFPVFEVIVPGPGQSCLVMFFGFEEVRGSDVGVGLAEFAVGGEFGGRDG